MKLKELRPRNSSFTLSKMKKEYHLRPITPNDHVLIEKSVGKIKDIFDNGKLFDLFKIAYVLIEPGETFDFAKKEVTFIDSEGNQVTQSTGGVALFVSMFADIDEQFEVLRAVLEAMGLSDEYIKEVMEKRDAINGIEIGAGEKKEEAKKKVKTVKKKVK